MFDGWMGWWRCGMTVGLGQRDGEMNGWMGAQMWSERLRARWTDKRQS